MDTELLGRLRTIAAARRERAPDQLNFHAAVNERSSLGWRAALSAREPIRNLV